jgi:uncharacterized membrane protein (UPF0127 family)
MSNRRGVPVYVYNMTRETFVATEAVVADGYLSRLVGLLGKTKRWARAGAGLWIVPSRGVHTIGMLFSIDLVFLNKNKEVVHVEEVVRPFRISRVSLKTDSVLELPPHTVYRTGTKVGDVLEISSATVPRQGNSDKQERPSALAAQTTEK